MFVKAIEKVSRFVRPIHFIMRNFGADGIVPGAATMFFVNNDGWALTCGHVADEIIRSEQRMQTYRAYQSDLRSSTGRARDLAKKYGYTSTVLVQTRVRFVGVGAGEMQLNIRRHPHHDVALLHFSTKPQFAELPLFGRNGSDLRQGKFLCRLGFPFPEFSNFRYDREADDIEWTSGGHDRTPQFPIEGMVTRHLGTPAGEIVGIELSTPGLRGQSGAPAFDTEGTVWGMQSLTRHLDLDFDIDQEVLRRGVRERRRDSAFLHVGSCVHVEILKNFMREQGVAFNEG